MLIAKVECSVLKLDVQCSSWMLIARKLNGE